MSNIQIIQDPEAPLAKKDSYYFSHDSGARNDPKILKLLRELGVEGYGIFWMVIEVLREQKDYKLPLTAIPDIAFDFHCSEEKVKSVVTRYELFVVDDLEFFFSRRLLRSMDEYNYRKHLLSEAGKRGNDKRWKNRVAITSPTPGDSNPIALKESKEKEYTAAAPPVPLSVSLNKVNETSPVIPPKTKDEIWPLLVEVWFIFNKERFGAEPSFKGVDGKALKNICDKLRKRAESAETAWDTNTAPIKLRNFLTVAYSDKWLSNNFLLKNIDSQFDKFALNQGAADNGGREKPKGGIYV